MELSILHRKEDSSKLNSCGVFQDLNPQSTYESLFWDHGHLPRQDTLVDVFRLALLRKNDL
jgi:hypothetical protein